MLNEPIRQHWVPKSYLRAFCCTPVEREQIHGYDLSKGRPFLASLDKVAVLKHFYTLGRGTGQQSYEVEVRLAQLESDAAPLLREIQSTRRVFTEQGKRQIFANFVATLLMRSRHGLQIVHAQRERLRTRQADRPQDATQSYENEFFALDDEGMRELFAKSVISMGAPLSKVLLGMPWRLLEAEDGHFITSENPLLQYHPTEQEFGLGTPGTIIQLPISPTLLLWFDARRDLPDLEPFPLPAEGVHGVNGLIVQGAEQFLFSDQGFESQGKLLSGRRVNTRPEFGPAPRTLGKSKA